MSSYVLKRLVAMVFMVWGVTLMIFIIMEMAPGGPEMIFLAETMDFSMREQILHSLGLDQPAHLRYLKWLGAALQGDLGQSLTGAGIPVTVLIVERLGATTLLIGTSLVFSVAVAIVLGVVSAVSQYSWLDRIVTLYAYFGMSFPNFWLGIMLIWLFSITLGWLPSSGISEYGLEYNVASRLSHLILPVMTQSAVWIGTYVRFVRGSMLEILHSDFVRTARAKGLSERVVLYKHALRNGLIPFVTVLGLSMPAIVAGSVFVETIFAWPGLGRLTVQSVYRRDYPIIMAVGLIVSLAVILANMVVDVSYALIDPRITYD